MQKVKLFKGVEMELSALEDDINSWIEENKAKVISVTGNIAPQTGGAMSESFGSSDILVIVTYEN